MSNKFTRTINISCQNLGGSTPQTLVLTFDKQTLQGIYKDYFPTVWKITSFPPSGSYSFTATYHNQLMFTTPQVENGNVITASTWIDVNVGEQTDLIEDTGSRIKSFTPPTTSSDPNNIKAINKTNNIQAIGVGFDNGGAPPPTMLVFSEVGPTHNVTAQFTPTLTAYIASDYQENDVIRGAIQSLPIWEKDLSQLSQSTHWRLVRDGDSGSFSIIPA